MRDPLFIVIDLFCGFGGTTRGFELAQLDGREIAKVFACVNHDPKAIKSHWLNHPEVRHFEEDIRTLDLTELVALVAVYRRRYPDAKLILWASLECTNFSKAKGGQPRDADSRTLADHLPRYITALDPDYIQIENVVEFMSWGPLDENGKPVSKKSGEDWLRWRGNIRSMGYVDEWRELNSANYGAYTSRNRLFGVFARPELPIAWPAPTHAKAPSKMSMFGDLKKWMPVKDVLNFDDEGESIFGRKKSLSDNTLERIYAGLVKYIARGDTAFISKYFSGQPSTKNIPMDGPAGTIKTRDGQSLVQAAFLTKTFSGKPEGKNIPVTGPAGTITTFGGSHALVQPAFLVKYNSKSREGHYVPPSIEDPAPTIACQRTPGLVQPEFLTIYNGKSENRSVDEPAPTVATHDRFGLVQPEYFIDKHFGKSQNQSIDDPAGTIMPNDKHRLVTAEPFIMPTAYQNLPKSVGEPAPTLTASRRHHYLVNAQWVENTVKPDEPFCVVTHISNIDPIYFAQVADGRVIIAIYVSDSPVAIRIKQFMAAYGLVDIKMRMLRVVELLLIQGFPGTYKMIGNQSDQKKFIGNSVHPLVPKHWIETMGIKLIDHQNKKVA